MDTGTGTVNAVVNIQLRWLTLIKCQTSKECVICGRPSARSDSFSSLRKILFLNAILRPYPINITVTGIHYRFAIFHQLKIGPFVVISVVEPEPAPMGFFAGAGAVKNTGSSSGYRQS